MDKQLPKLPIGIQTFEEIRNEGYLYVDKTKYLIELIDNGKVYFLSRPRRFGKSVTISTFDALFSGKKDLFKGLDAEEFFNRPRYKPRPVLRLDMSKVVANRGMEILLNSMTLQMKESAERHSVGLSELALKDPATAFGELIRRVAQKEDTPAALLIDEYDHPILDFITQPGKAHEIRSVLKDFYAQIKASDEYLSFIFVTGISKFSKMGIFSPLNNLLDISAMDKYATILGYTEDELMSNFDRYIDATAIVLEKSKDELVVKIRDYYDGFSFDGKNRLYNPFSTLSFFANMAFKNYWFESGTPPFLVEYARQHDLEAESFRGLDTNDEFASLTEIENATPESFLFQSGYLSVREKRGRKLILDYPNKEVLSSVANLFLYGKFKASNAGSFAIDLEEALGLGDAEGLVKIYNALLAAIPYDVYEREEQKYAREHERKDSLVIPYAESFYHAVLFSLLWASLANTTAESHSYWGRSDIEAERNGHRYVVELKIAESKETAAKAADGAIEQIRKKGYADRYAKNGAVLVGLAVDRSARRVEAYRIESL